MPLRQWIYFSLLLTLGAIGFFPRGAQAQSITYTPDPSRFPILFSEVQTASCTSTGVISGNCSFTQTIPGFSVADFYTTAGFAFGANAAAVFTATNGIFPTQTASTSYTFTDPSGVVWTGTDTDQAVNGVLTITTTQQSAPGSCPTYVIGGQCLTFAYTVTETQQYDMVSGQYSVSRTDSYSGTSTDGAGTYYTFTVTGTASTSGIVSVNTSTTVAAQSCSASEGGCNLSNGVIPHSVQGGPSPLPGTVTESSCKVPQDPRVVQYGTCTGHSLPVAQVCPGFGNTVIPDYLCGGAGPAGTGFDLVNTVAEGVDALSGIYVESEAFADVALGGSPPACPQTVVGWAPRSASSVEGTVPEGNNMLELTSGCGSSKIGSRGLSLYAVGLTLNTDALPGVTQREKLKLFTAQKYQNLFASIAAGNMTRAARTKVNACVSVSELLFTLNNFCPAARALVACDAKVAADIADFSGSPTDPNVWGDIRGRLANLYLTINTRLEGNPPNTSWPPANLPSCQ